MWPGGTRTNQLPKPPPVDPNVLSFTLGKDEYSDLLRSAKISHGHDTVISDCKMLLGNKARYETVAKVFNAPWVVVGMIHLLEASLSFHGVLHNGEHIIGTGKKTSMIPKGRGPFATWEESAVDALTLQRMNVIKTWSVEMMLGFLERYNGMGYRSHGINSPYLWSFTNHYTKGKYTADGHWDANAVSLQVGCGAILLGLVELGWLSLIEPPELRLT